MVVVIDFRRLDSKNNLRKKFCLSVSLVSSFKKKKSEINPSF